MNVTLNLPPEAADKLQKKAAQEGVTLEKFIESIALHLADVKGNGAKAEESPEEWEQEWRAWAASHKPSLAIADDSRESIYAGRGE